jgi:DNA processing protein
MKLTSIQAFLLLQFLPGIGDITVKKLVDHCGNTQAVFEEEINLLKIKGIGMFHFRNLIILRLIFRLYLRKKSF